LPQWRVDLKLACDPLDPLLFPGCVSKWVLFTLARLLEAKGRMGSESGHGAASADVAGAEEGEIESLYEKLKSVDPFRAELYEDRLASCRLRKVRGMPLPQQWLPVAPSTAQAAPVHQKGPHLAQGECTPV